MSTKDLDTGISNGWHIAASIGTVHWSMSGICFNAEHLISGLVIKNKRVYLPVIGIDHSESGWLMMLANKEVRLSLDFVIRDNYCLECSAELEIKEQVPLAIESVIIAALDSCCPQSRIDLDSHVGTYRVLATTFDMLGGSRPWVRSQTREQDGDMPGDYADMVGAIWSTESRNTLIVGTVGNSDFPLSLEWVDKHTEKETVSIERQINLIYQPGAKASLGSIVFQHGKDLTAGLSEYAERYFKPRRPSSFRITGWNTWDYYTGHPTMEDVLENMEAIRENPGLSERIKIICIDMGWYNRVGDYRANIDFCSDRSKVAQIISAKGFVPGIWTIPLGVGPDTAIAKRHTDWLICDSQNQPVNVMAENEPTYCLDVTVPAVQEHLLNIFSKMREEGFGYFKLDFLRYAYKRAEVSLHDPSVSRQQIVRKALEIIRQAVGDESIIMASAGGVFEAAQGIVDAVRVANDVKIYWSNFQHCASQIAHRFWSHGNLWINDPDFLVVRGIDTADLSEERYICPFSKEHEPFAFISGTPATLNEVQVWASVQIISGGPLMLSDRIAKLKRNGLEIIEKIFQYHSPACFVPLDLMHRSAPCVWARDDSKQGFASGKYDMIAIFNWEEESRTIDLSRWNFARKWYSIWDETQVEIGRQIEIPQRSVMLLKTV
ncbi:MAG: glycoside hydrolase family 36 protein [Planctomycetota bacterium]